MTFTLTRFCFPSAEICKSTELYLRLSREAEHTLGTDEVRLPEGASVCFNTYFNAFPVNKWLKHTTVRHVYVVFQASGALRAEVIHDPDGRHPRVVAAHDFKSSERAEVALTLPPLDQLRDGAMFLRVTALADGAALRGGEWCTDDAPSRRATVGVVITTFGHEDQVRNNTTRLLAALPDEPPEHDSVEIVVVDNRAGDALSLPNEVTVLKNRNLGGAGGFARGLMHLRAQTRCTHALFMDDDVWFEPDVVLRTVALLSFASDPNLCVSGAMLADTRPTIQYEAGSKFRGRAVYPNRPLGSNLDLEDWDDVLEVNLERQSIDYGAWWFFAFPVGLTRDNPIPAFVRGDDICWGTLHAGRHTMVMSGLAVWHLDFETKNSPTSWFYDTRNYALVSVLSTPRYRTRHLLVRYLNICGRSMLSLKYSSAELITFGLQEFFRGPEHWMGVDQPALHEEVRTRDHERPAPLDPALAAIPDLPVYRGLMKWLLAIRSLLVLSGHLMPDHWNRKPMGAVPVQQRALGVATGRQGILYRDESGTSGFVARRDRQRFFQLARDMIRTSWLVITRFRATAREYRAAYPRMVSDSYWTGQFRGN